MTEDLPVQLSGSTLIVGPSKVGKTRLTARALQRWVERHGTEGVVILEFAPEVERDGTIFGGRLDRFVAVPDDVWHGVLDAHAPRAEGQTDAEALELARDNAERASRLLDAAPADPRAAFVNDATIPFQHERGDVDRLTTYCDRASSAVVNAFESDELGTDDPISTRERNVLRVLHSWADRVISLDDSEK